MKNLLIVESPAKAVKIEKMFQGSVVAIASQGHIKDLAKGSKGIDTKDFSLTYDMMPDKERVLQSIFSLIDRQKVK